MTPGEWAGLLPWREERVWLLGAECCPAGDGVEAEALLIAVLWRIELRVAVEKGQRGCGGGVKAELALAAFEGDGGERQRGVGAVVNGDFHFGGCLKVGAEGGGDRELIEAEDGAGAGEMDAADGAADLLAGAFGLAGCVAGDDDVAAEVWYFAGGEGEADALDRDVSDWPPP